MRLAATINGRIPYSRFLATVAQEDLTRSPARTRAHMHLMRATAFAGLGNRDEAAAELTAGQDAGAQDDGPIVFVRADVCLAAGDLPGAIKQLRKGVDDFRRSGGLAYASTLLGMLAAALAEQGDDLEAAATIDEAVTVTSPHDAQSVALMTGVRAVLMARAGKYDRASSLTEHCLAVLDPMDMLVLRGDLYRWLAEVPALRGEVGEQRRLLSEALASYREKEHLAHAVRTERAMADLG